MLLWGRQQCSTVILRATLHVAMATQELLHVACPPILRSPVTHVLFVSMWKTKQKVLKFSLLVQQ